jgi:hypothetical protein
MLALRLKSSLSCLVASAAVALTVIGISDATAQYPLPRRPITSTPTISPYLDLLAEPRGPLPNYFQLVRPRQQLRNALQRQEIAIQRQQQTLQTLDRRLDSSLRLGGVAPTGVQGGYVDYSHFYPGLSRR